MYVEVLHKPDYALGVVKLRGGEQVLVEGGSMVGMSSGVTLETRAEGGLLKALGRAVLGGESFFFNTFTAPAQGGEVMVAPALPGDLAVMEVQQSLFVASGCFAASEKTLDIDARWTGAKTFFGGQGFLMLDIRGTGKVLVSAFGAIHEIVLGVGQAVTVDTGHIVAFDPTVQYNVRFIGGVKSTVFCGEGLVVDLAGPGRVLMQTRNPYQFISWMDLHLPRHNRDMSRAI